MTLTRQARKMTDFCENLSPLRRQQVADIVSAGLSAMITTAETFGFKLLSDDSAANLGGAMITYVKESTGWESTVDLVEGIIAKLDGDLADRLDDNDRTFAVQQLNRGVSYEVVALRLREFARDYPIAADATTAAADGSDSAPAADAPPTEGWTGDENDTADPDAGPKGGDVADPSRDD